MSIINRESIILQAVKDLDEKLHHYNSCNEEKITPFNVYVIGDFALCMDPISNIEMERMESIIDNIGADYSLSNDWFNNSSQFNNDLKDLSKYIGSLEFNLIQNGSTIDIYSLDHRNLIRVCLIHADSYYISKKTVPKRIKDDIIELMKKFNLDERDLIEIGKDFVLNPIIYSMLSEV